MEEVKRENVKTWKRILEIPAYHVQEISDSGMAETYDGEEVESDDLRVTVVISGGHSILLPPGARIVLCENGNMLIEVLVKV